jgi:hypothetical protein
MFAPFANILRTLATLFAPALKTIFGEGAATTHLNWRRGVGVRIMVKLQVT